MTETTERSRYQFDMEQVRRWYEDDGESVRMIARRLGMPDRTLWRYMNAAEIKMRPPGSNPLPSPSERKPVGPLEAQAIRQALQESEISGARLIDIAEQFGRSDTTIRRIARGAPRRRQEQAGKRKPSAPRIAEQMVRTAHATGLRGRQIDALYGWKTGRTAGIQKRLGLEVRRPTFPADELRALFARLGTVKAVAEYIGRDKNGVSKLLRDAGVDIRQEGHRPHRLDAYEDAIRQARLGPEKVALPELAARYGVPVPTMSGFLARRGILTYRIVTAAEHDEIVRLRAEGLSTPEIGRRLGRPPITIRKHLMPAPRPKLR